MSDHSNLDTWEHSGATDPACPCLPAVWWWPTRRDDEGRTIEVGGRYFHDAGVARVLRAEGGHP